MGWFMLGWSLAFFLAAIAVALLGFAAEATLAVMAKVLFWVFLTGSVVSLAMHFSRSRA
jgi:uncharacterized membrane protein YtjA (UPF0391 family)